MIRTPEVSVAPGARLRRALHRVRRPAVVSDVRACMLVVLLVAIGAAGIASRAFEQRTAMSQLRLAQLRAASQRVETTAVAVSASPSQPLAVERLGIVAPELRLVSIGFEEPATGTTGPRSTAISVRGPYAGLKAWLATIAADSRIRIDRLSLRRGADGLLDAQLRLVDTTGGDAGVKGAR